MTVDWTNRLPARHLKWFAPLITMVLTVPTLSSARADCRISDLYQTAAPQRFHANDDRTISDNVTGLMWRTCLLGLSGSNCDQGEPLRLNWLDAIEAATLDATATYNDWRLPNIKELASIIEYSCVGPSLDPDLFPNAGDDTTADGVTDYVIWTSTPYYQNGLIRYIDFSNGSDNTVDHTELHLIRLVRDINSDL